MKLVVDASVAVKWFVDERGADRAAALQGQSLCAPDLIFAEVGNALWRLQRQKVLSAADYSQAVDGLRVAPLTVAPLVELLPSAAKLAVELDHPLYDCFYLALAMREGCPLVTADQRLAALASARFGGFVRAL